MNFHYRYRLGVRSHPFISIDSQLQTLQRHTKNKTQKQIKHNNTKKELFSYQSIFLIAGACPKFPFFDSLAKKSAHPKNTIRIGVSARHF